MVKHKCIFKTNWSIIALQKKKKNPVYSMGSNTITLQTTTVFKEIKGIIALRFEFKGIKYYCSTNNCSQRNQNIIALRYDFKGIKYYYIMNYIQVNEMDQNILHSHLVLNSCTANMLCDSMFRVQNCTNCHLGSLNTHCCQLDSLIVTNYKPKFPNHQLLTLTNPQN